MIPLHINHGLSTPVYAQIAEQVKRLIVDGKLNPGEHLPSTRALAKYLDVNQNTVLKSYSELAKERIVISRRGEGTIVAQHGVSQIVLIEREQRLSNIVSNSMLEALSAGYSLEDIDAAFHLQLARWREEVRNRGKLTDTMPNHSKANTISIIGSHDLALDVLVSQFKTKRLAMNIEVINTGSIGGLIALQEGKAQIAGIHLLDEDTGEYNYSYVKHLFPGRDMAMVHLAYRMQGLMFVRNNPKEIKSLADLRRQDLIFINRQKGSGTRVLLDFELKHNGIQPDEVRGYGKEVDTHTAVAMTIAQGEANIGLGIQAAAKSFDLDFLPLFKERYDLVASAEAYNSPLLAPVLDIIASDDFKMAVDNLGGYDTSQTGNVTFC